MKNKKYIIEFYNSTLYIPGMMKSYELTDDILSQLENTMMFAKWMLATNTKKCVLAIKECIKTQIDRNNIFDRINKKFKRVLK